jgi:hypothetical protein
MYIHFSVSFYLFSCPQAISKFSKKKKAASSYGLSALAAVKPQLRYLSLLRKSYFNPLTYFDGRETSFLSRVVSYY